MKKLIASMAMVFAVAAASVFAAPTAHVSAAKGVTPALASAFKVASTGVVRHHRRRRRHHH